MPGRITWPRDFHLDKRSIVGLPPSRVKLAEQEALSPKMKGMSTAIGTQQTSRRFSAEDQAHLCVLPGIPPMAIIMPDDGPLDPPRLAADSSTALGSLPPIPNCTAHIFREIYNKDWLKTLIAILTFKICIPTSKSLTIHFRAI